MEYKFVIKTEILVLLFKNPIKLDMNARGKNQLINVIEL